MSEVQQLVNAQTTEKPKSAKSRSLSITSRFSITREDKNAETRKSMARAADVGDIDLLKRLMAQDGVSFVNNTFGQFKDSLLIIAARSGQNEIVKMLLQIGAEKDATSTYGSTALHEAAGAGHEDVVITLLNAGCNPLARNKYGQTPFLCAACSCFLEVMKAILGYCLENNICQPSFFVGQKNMAGTNALDFAKQKAELQVLEFLNWIDTSPTTEMEDSKLGLTRIYTIPELANELSPKKKNDCEVEIQIRDDEDKVVIKSTASDIDEPIESVMEMVSVDA